MSVRDTVPRSVCPTEEEALRRLELLDLEGAREKLEGTVEEVLATSHDQTDAAYLLYDILSRVDRIVAEHQELPQRGLPERLRTIRRLAASATLVQLAASFWTAYEELIRSLSGMPPPGHPAVEHVKSYVRQNYRRKISLSDIARAVGISRNYLSHLFKRHCGVTVTEFIHRTRMKEAEKLLIDGGRSVSAVAYTVGYQNYRDFHRNFVKYEKTSPKKFRQVRSRTRLSAARV